MKMILLLFSSWLALESLKKMKMILLLFFILACSRVFGTLQVVLTWVQGRPNEARVALEDVSPPWMRQQIRQLTVLSFLCAFKKAGLGSSQDATCFKGRTRQRWVANS